MANLDLLVHVVDKLETGTQHVVDTADHGFKVLKKRKIKEDVMSELARVSAEWIAKTIG